MTTVSVCIPVYNRATELDRALASVVAQTYRDLEIIVLDNASTDDSHGVAARYAAADPRVRVLRNDELLGKAENWRRCLSYASGTYLKLLFSDDWLAPEAIERAVAQLAGDPGAGFVYTAMAWQHGDRVDACYTGPGGVVDSADFLHRSATIADLVPVTTSCALLRTADAREFFAERIPSRLADDTHGIGIGYSGMLLWRCADRYPRVRHIGEVLAHSADPQQGEANSRTRYRDRAEMLWWGHRNAFAHFIDSSSQPAAARRTLISTMFFSTVPLRRDGFGRRRAVFGRLFPGFRLRHLRPWDRHVRPHVWYRLRSAPYPEEILA